MKKRGGDRRLIAFIDDNELLVNGFAEVLPTLLFGAEVSSYANVEAWEQDGNPQYEVFIVGQKMGGSFMLGSNGVRLIRARFPDALIVGWSADKVYQPVFLAAGADVFVFKLHALENIVALLLSE